VVQSLAAAAGQLLFYIPALDIEGRGPTLTRDEKSGLRYHANPNHTGGRAGLLALYEGMRVELSEKFSAKANALKASQIERGGAGRARAAGSRDCELGIEN